MVFQLPDDDTFFPDPLLIPEGKREPDGFYAIGGDLSPERLIEAYSQGIFPWTAFRDLEVAAGEERGVWNQLRWYCPMDRFVIFPHEIHISHSMRTLMNKGEHEITRDESFPEVIAHCSQADQRFEEEGAWLGPQMIAAYTRLHKLGIAHSVEVWRKATAEEPGRTLAGGLYGVMLQGAFFGESMFSLAPSASKLALIHLAQFLRQTGGKFIDCQFETPHLRAMGGRHIPYEEYMRLLFPFSN